MENDKLNKIIIQAVFGVLVVVPLVIGISLYSRPHEITNVQNPPYPSPVPTPYVYPTPTQSRYYVYGWAFDQSTAGAITADFTNQDGKVYPLTKGYFSFPVSPSTTYVSLYIEGYKKQDVAIGPDSPGMAFNQDLGNLYFEKEGSKNITVEDGWAKYENSKFKYSVQYPEVWTYAENINGGGYTNGSVSFSVGSDYTSIVTMLNYQDFGSGGVEDYVAEYLKNQTVKINKTYLTIDDKTAIQLEIPSTNVIVTYAKRQTDNQVFQWTLWKNTPENKKNYNLMLEKFTY
jgi:hypothetical protein